MGCTRPPPQGKGPPIFKRDFANGGYCLDQNSLRIAEVRRLPAAPGFSGPSSHPGESQPANLPAELSHPIIRTPALVPPFPP